MTTENELQLQSNIQKEIKALKDMRNGFFYLGEAGEASIWTIYRPFLNENWNKIPRNLVVLLKLLLVFLFFQSAFALLLVYKQWNSNLSTSFLGQCTCTMHPSVQCKAIYVYWTRFPDIFLLKWLDFHNY